MALVFMDGFDLKNGVEFRDWFRGGQAFTYDYLAGDISGSSVRLRLLGSPGTANAYMSRNLPSTYTEAVWGFRFKTESWGAMTNDNILSFLTSGSAAYVAAIRISSLTGKLSVVNSAGTTIATGYRTVLGTGWHYIEFRTKVNGASGEVQVYMDGTEEITTTVGNFGSTNIAVIRFHIYDRGVFSTGYIDDVYVVDTTGGAPLNTFLGDSHIETLMPTSDGANADWVPNSGATEYTQVDDNPYDSDTTYISDATPGDISTFGCSNLPFTSGTVYAVQPNLMARKDEATLREMRPVIRQGGVDYSVGTVAALSTGYLQYASLLPLDPVAATWTAANVNANEYGVELVT